MGKNKDIREAVEAELAFDPLVDDSGITVANLGGDIALNGSVPSYPQFLEATAAAQRVDGVTKVHNHIEVWLLDGDYRDDATLTTVANNALALAVTVPDGVEATAHDGTVTLTGTVSYGTERSAAEFVASNLIGVRNLKNRIEVWSAVDPADVIVRVQAALDRNALILDDSDVVVDTEDRTVSLVGHVRTWAERDAVVEAAWRAEGVYDVLDELIITG